MTEKSWYWSGVTTGDATDAPYDDDEFSDIWRKLFQRDRTLQGVIEDYENELAVSNPAGSTIRVATGAALVDGKFYENDANVDTGIATPVSDFQINRFVLRKSWAAQTVRIVNLIGAIGGAAPALTQTDGVTWEIPLAQASITSGGVITLTDERVNARTPLGPPEGGMQEIETVSGDNTSTILQFANIPQTFTHLFFVGNMRLAGAVIRALLDIRFNSDSGANYDEQSLTVLNAAVQTNPNNGTTGIEAGSAPGANADADHVSQIQGHIANYTQTDFFKTVLGQFSNLPEAAAITSFDAGHYGGIWENTDAVTILEFISSSGNWTAETVVTLYGLE